MTFLLNKLRCRSKITIQKDTKCYHFITQHLILDKMSSLKEKQLHPKNTFNYNSCLIECWHSGMIECISELITHSYSYPIEQYISKCSEMIDSLEFWVDWWMLLRIMTLKYERHTQYIYISCRFFLENSLLKGCWNTDYCHSQIAWIDFIEYSHKV